MKSQNLSKQNSNALSKNLQELFAKVLDSKMTEAGLVFQREVPPALKVIYGELLSDIPPRDLRQAFNAALGHCKFFPTPADIREHWERENSSSILNFYQEASDVTK